MTRNMLSACQGVLAFTHICMSTRSHTHHKASDVTLNGLGRVWPAAVILWMVARNAHFDIQLRCCLWVSLQWGEPRQFLVILRTDCWETQTITRHWCEKSGSLRYRLELLNHCCTIISSVGNIPLPLWTSFNSEICLHIDYMLLMKHAVIFFLSVIVWKVSLSLYSWCVWSRFSVRSIYQCNGSFWEINILAGTLSLFVSLWLSRASSFLLFVIFVLR